MTDFHYYEPIERNPLLAAQADDAVKVGALCGFTLDEVRFLFHLLLLIQNDKPELVQLFRIRCLNSLPIPDKHAGALAPQRAAYEPSALIRDAIAAFENRLTEP